MPHHLHLISNTKTPFELDNVVRDFKRHTSKNAILLIETEPDSRREWALDRFAHAVKIHPKNKNHKVWQDKNHAIELYTERVRWQKLNYVHRNPVIDRIVYNEQDYLFISARNYYRLPKYLRSIA